MNRRSFLKGILGAGVALVLEALIHGQDRIVNMDPMGPQQYSIGFNPYLSKSYVYIDERWRGV